MGFGERLQREREMRGIALDEIAQATKIGTRALRALEQEQFDALPGGIFNKGFVRSYARYVGIDEEQAVADYLTAVGEPQEENPLTGEHLKKLEEHWKTPRERYRGASPLIWGVPLVIVLLLLVGAGLSAWHFRYRVVTRYHQWKFSRHLPGDAARQPEAVSATGFWGTRVGKTAQQVLGTAPAGSPTRDGVARDGFPSPASPPPAARNMVSAAGTIPPSGGSVPAAVPEVTAKEMRQSTPDQAQDGFVVMIYAREDSWVSITADGKPAMKGVLIASRKTSVHAREKLTLVAGNAGGLEVWFNGKPQPSLENGNRVRTVTFTSEGMQP